MSYIDLPKEAIDKVFEDVENSVSPHQANVIVGLYKLVYPDWDKIAKVDGWPQVTRKTNEYIFRKMIAFDDKHHKKVFRGGIWMNNGFGTCSTPADLLDWQVSKDNVKIVYFEEGEDESGTEGN